jgi:hypothetical protein
MLTKPAIEQREHNSEPNSCNISNPILHIRAAPKGGLDKLYETAKGACTYKDWNKSNAACTRQWKGQGGKGKQVHDFVASLWRRGRLMDGPKHGHCQNSCHNQSEGDIEMLAHVNGVQALGLEHKEKP